MLQRLRRLRMSEALRDLVQETTISQNDFIYPLFVRHGENIKNEIASMPEVYQMSIDVVLKECEEIVNLGIKSIILFGIPEIKDSVGSEAMCSHGIVPKAIKAIKSRFPKLFIVADLCFCEYTDHGHCGILDLEKESVNNDLTLEILGKQALVLANAGVDMLAPSGMMDGVISYLREVLDKNSFTYLPIMSYSTKFASAYYGPFRDVAESTPSFGDRKSYQLNPANRLEAIRESILDEEEGADILMVKPALAYLDIIRDIKNSSKLPLAIYNVSGEYAMLKFAGKSGLIDYDRVLLETMIGFKRAGASIIISYHAKEVCKLLK